MSWKVLFLIPLLALARLFGATGGAELDPSFNPNLSISGPAGFYSGIRSMALQADGKILIGGGFTNVDGALRHHLARLNPDGTLDHTFIPSGTTNDSVESIAVHEDGKILLTGGSQNTDSHQRTTIIRLNADGSPDPGFHIPALSSRLTQILLGQDSMIYICGHFSSVDNTPRRYLARLHPNGDLDETYVPAILQHSSGEGGMVRMAQQADFKILLAGMFFTPSGGGIFARFQTDGSEDLSFRGRGVYFCSDLQVLPNGNILHVSSVQASSEYAVLRVFDSTGTQVPSFRDRNQIPGHVIAAVVQPDGKILFGGSFLDPSIGYYGKNLARVRSDGALDPSFDVGTGFAVAHVAWDFAVAVGALLLQTDGKILVAGRFNFYDGQARTNLVRLMGQRVYPQRIQAGDTISLTWQILPNDQLWRIESSEDLRSWTSVREQITSGLVQLEDTSPASTKFFRVVPDQ